MTLVENLIVWLTSNNLCRLSFVIITYFKQYLSALNIKVETYAIVTMVLLGNDEFLSELSRLFEKSRLAGSVMLSIKRFNGHNKPIPRKGQSSLPKPNEYLCLVRATLRSKKISTVIHSKDVNKFQQAYWSLLKTNINGLKKLKKIKVTKPKAH